MTAIQCYSTNIQIFKSFKLYCIQGSIAAWLKLSFKHSNHSSFLNSSQLFSMASAFLQTFRYSNHSKFISFETALQRSFSFQHSHRNFFRNCFSSVVFKILLILACHILRHGVAATHFDRFKPFKHQSVQLR